jgi:PPOX class probable F420-dependent enzyme
VPSIEDARRLSQMEHGLATLATVRSDGSVQLTVVNAGVVTHPVTACEVPALVTAGSARKLGHLRRHPAATVLWRSGWSWVAVEGIAELCGPNDALEGVGPEDLRRLLRTVAQAAGAGHEDWHEYDRWAAAEQRTAVLLTPRRIYQNP